jgi:hypothetical protein
VSGCSCVYVDVDNDGSWEEILTKQYPSPTIHKCSECLRIIQPGENYEIVVGVSIGGYKENITINRTCPDCLSIRDAFFCDGYYFEMVWENLWEHLTEINGEIGCGCVEGLTDGAKEKLFEYMDEIFEDFVDDDEEE